MINYRTKAILKREIVQQIFSKRFLIMTLSIPVLMGVVIGLQFFIATFDKESKAVLYILNESSGFQQQIEAQFADSELANPELYELHYELVKAADLEKFVDDRRQALLRGGITGIVFIPDAARSDKKISYYSSNPSNQILLGRVREQVNRSVVESYFRSLNLDTDAIEFARTNVSVDGVRVTRSGNSGTNVANLIVAIGFTFLMYISLLGTGPVVMAAVNEEKTNRVVEVLMSAVKPQELMYGKIFGTALAGLVQMAIWISPVVILSLASLPALVAFNSLDFQLNWLQILYFLVNYLIGVLTFLGIFAAFGSMFDTPQDAQGSMMPVMMLIIVPFLLTFTMLKNPANTLAEVCSMLPFASLLVMPARMSLIDVPAWQIGAALLVNLATFWFFVRGGAKIYRITILMTGKRPSWPEIWKWLRYAQ